MMEKDKPLRVLIVEDVEADVMLLVRELRKNGFAPEYRCIETSQDMHQALREPWDLVLSDFSLPRFNGVEALKILKAHDIDIPFIVVSGTIGENVAVSMMREGAHDYFLKGQLSRLGPAVERELREARERHARREAEKERDRLFNLSQDMLCIAGFDGYYKQLNPAWEEILGWSMEELLSRPIREWIHPDEVEAAHENLLQLMEGRIISNATHRLKCKDGSYRWISLNAFPLMEEQQIYAVARDVTEQRNLEEQLRQSQKMEAVGQLAGGVAHDFNNQLTVIAGYSEILLQNMTKDDPAYSSLQAVFQACHRARELTEQLLAFSRKQILRPEVLDLDAVLREMTGPLARMVGEQVELRITPAGDLRHVKLDRRQFEQAIFNLVINARDAMPAGGRVTIETANTDFEESVAPPVALPAGPYVALHVGDTGQGISPDVRKQIFEPFFTTKEPGQGTGLGLSMVYGFVRQSGGAIDVRSRPGSGATFTLLFPATDEPLEIPAVSPGEPVPRGGDETILVAEDDESVRQLVVHVLREAGYTVLETANAREAMPLGHEYAAQIDLMLTDVIMPGLSGLELAKKIQPLRPDMRVLFISGYAKLSALAGGGEFPTGAGFLAKPFSREALLQAVRSTLDAPSEPPE